MKTKASLILAMAILLPLANLKAQVVSYVANLGTAPDAQGFPREETSGHPQPTVSGGVLHQFRREGDSSQYWYNSSPSADFTIDTFILEATLHVISSDYIPDIGGGHQRSGYYLTASDDSRRVFNIGISSGGITINSDGQLVPTQGVPFTPFDTTDRFHDYRFVVKAGTASLFIDGTLFATLPVGAAVVPANYPRASFGDGSGVAASETELRSFRATALREDTRLDIRVSQVELCWASRSNIVYQLQYRSELTTNAWASLTNCISGDGTRKCLRDEVAVGAPQRFYRVVTVTNCRPGL